MKNQFNLNIKNAGRLTSFVLACLTLFTFATTQAQVTTNKVQESFVVKGNVSDEFEAIPGVNIVLEGTEIGTATDFDGNFEFPQKLSKGDVLIFSYVGLESQKVVIEYKDSASNIPLDISLKLDPVVIMGELAVKQVYKSSRSK